MTPVYITRLAKFLPNEPVCNDDMEQILGMVDGKPSRARHKILENNKIHTRYYALDPKGNSTHTNAQLAARCIEGLLDDKISKNDIELLVCGCVAPDQLLPSQAAMVHGELGCPPIEVISVNSACASGFQAFKYAYLSVKAGESTKAVACGSEKVSGWLKAEKFKAEAENLKQLEADPMIAFEKDFLRWMISDGAGAALLQNEPNTEGISLRVDWIEMKSFANELPACMYAGAVRSPDGSLTGWADYPIEEWGKQSIFSFKQDTRLLGVKVVPIGSQYWKELVEKHNIDIDKLTWFLPHISSEFFREKIANEITRLGVPIAPEKWFTNLSSVGNIGSAAPYVMLEELFNNGKLKKGDTIVIMVPESARFTYIYAHLTVV